MAPKYKNYFLTFFSFILMVITTPWFGRLYEKILGRKLSSFIWGPDNPQYLDGFFMSYVFFVTIFIMIFGTKNKYKHLAFALGIIFAFDILLGVWEGLIINIGIAIVAWLLAQGILFVKKYIIDHD